MIKRIIIEKDDASPWRATFEGDVSRADINRVLRTLLRWYRQFKLTASLKKKQAEINRAEAMRKAKAEAETKKPEPEPEKVPDPEPAPVEPRKFKSKQALEPSLKG